jgi:hypothetical protein
MKGGSRFWEDIRACEVSSVHFLVYMLAVVFVIIHVTFVEVGIVARITASPIFPHPPHRQEALVSIVTPIPYLRVCFCVALKKGLNLLSLS